MPGVFVDTVVWLPGTTLESSTSLCWPFVKTKKRRGRREKLKISTPLQRKTHHLTESSHMGGKHEQDDYCTKSQMTQINSTGDDSLRVTAGITAE